MRLPRPAVPDGLAPQARAIMETLAVSGEPVLRLLGLQQKRLAVRMMHVQGSCHHARWRMLHTRGAVSFQQDDLACPCKLARPCQETEASN